MSNIMYLMGVWSFPPNHSPPPPYHFCHSPHEVFTFGHPPPLITISPITIPPPPPIPSDLELVGGEMVMGGNDLNPFDVSKISVWFCYLLYVKDVFVKNCLACLVY